MSRWLIPTLGVLLIAGAALFGPRGISPGGGQTTKTTGSAPIERTAAPDDEEILIGDEEVQPYSAVYSPEPRPLSGPEPRKAGERLIADFKAAGEDGKAGCESRIRASAIH